MKIDCGDKKNLHPAPKIIMGGACRISDVGSKSNADKMPAA